jgi:UDP-N-acetylglucosamine--N-acetylmuramyl-(pentapeptide) pyrophosphoryl-undecaprenol N-acetylglucosamine transferase
LRKVYFAVFGSGLGHVTRSIEIAKGVEEKGGRVRYSSSGQGLRYIRTHRPESDCVESPFIDAHWAEDGSFSARAFMLRFPRMFQSFLKQVAFEAKSIKGFDPAVTVSDSRLSAVLAASWRSSPVVTILNQFKVTIPPRFRTRWFGQTYERIAGDGLGLLWSLSEQVLVTDLPPPYTIGEANISGTGLSNIVRYVGFTSPDLRASESRLKEVKEGLGLDGRPIVFVQISGPDATKERFIKTVLRSANTLSGRYNMVVSMGFLGGSGQPRRLTDGTLLYDWCPVRDELFLLSSAIVSRSGHRTIGQCIDTEKPAVLVPIRNHSEQLGNADKFQKLGLGLFITQETLSPEVLTESVDLCVQDPRYRKNVVSVARVSRRYRGVETCAEVINSYG